jgi:hypothetical protein
MDGSMDQWMDRCTRKHDTRSSCDERKVTNLSFWFAVSCSDDVTLCLDRHEKDVLITAILNFETAYF